MPGIVALVSAISDAVVAALAVANDPPLVDGAILLGAQHIFEASSAPRVVFVLMGSVFGGRDVANRQQSPAEVRAEYTQRALFTDKLQFEVHCWGQASPADPNNDRDATQRLYQTVIAQAWLAAVGCSRPTSGKWTDSKPQGTKLMTSGWEFVFTLEFDTPLCDVQLPLAPSDTVAATSSVLVTSDGSSVGCTS